VPAFEVTPRRLEWFEDRVLWLAPEPEQPFLALTNALRQRFASILPYEGANPDPVPDVTVGHDAPVEVLKEAARTIEPRLPVTERITEAQLMQGSSAPGS
jgi:2'-5' RNA ligase